MGETLKGLLAGTGLIDLVLCIAVLEFLLLELWLRKTERTKALFEMRPMLISALWLLLALRSVMTSEHWLITVGFLVAAGFAHIVDLRQRLLSPAE